ncbi:MAG TPA: 5-deoxy-glucuronate isomerase [Dermatophilaceae bacterium]|nr:5-deoxy-glucuronate isomerase [Dermatophilaceae bacterium]
MTRFHYPAGVAGTPRWPVALPPGTALTHAGLYVVDLDANLPSPIPTGRWESLVIPLNGGPLIVSHPTGDLHLTGRPDVWGGPTDTAYLPPGLVCTITSPQPGTRVAIACARVEVATPRPVHRIDPTAVAIELRGAGAASRQVNGLGMPDVLDAEALLVCEVLTPSGNWSSYPPHKHDEHLSGRESALEEFYYLVLRAQPGPRQGERDHDAVGYLRVAGNPGRPVDLVLEVRTGDVVAVPFGWHGPAMAPPGYDMYYLNVMAGPGPERQWLIRDEPSHEWVRGSWIGAHPDPRLPFGSVPAAQSTRRTR